MTPEEIKVLQDKLAKAESDLVNSQKLTESLKEAIVEQEKVTSPAAGATTTSLLPDKPVTIDKEKYKIIFPKFSHKGVEYTAHQLAKDENLQKELVAIGFGGLQKVA